MFVPITIQSVDHSVSQTVGRSVSQPSQQLATGTHLSAEGDDERIDCQFEMTEPTCMPYLS